MQDWHNILIAGTGPASVQMALLFKSAWKCRIAIAGRQSARSAPFFAALQQSGRRIRVAIQNRQHSALQGECRVDHIFDRYEAITGQWDTVILAVTADAYIEVLKQLRDDVIRQFKRVVLLSPTFGSGSLIRQFMNDRYQEAEVISLSTYLGDTRWLDHEPPNQVITTAVKRTVFAGSTLPCSISIEKLQRLYASLGIVMEAMPSPIEAETRNISLYVHPALFMNAYALSAVFRESPDKKYVYKLFPEGPITQTLIRHMLAAWKEISALIDKLHISGVNLLKFMTDDNYPVRAESLSRSDIESFTFLEPVHQEYLLYVRYASLLIDPFSEPDEDGRYFDFSAVPVRPIFVNEEGCWDIPRMPKEDYYRIKIIQGIARHLDSACPTIDQFIFAYESALEAAALKRQDERLSQAFAVLSFEEDIQRICKEIESRR